MSDIKKKKSSLWIVLFALPILAITAVGFVAGAVWMYLASGFMKGQDYFAKLSGYETQKEMIHRIIEERTNA